MSKTKTEVVIISRQTLLRRALVSLLSSYTDFRVQGDCTCSKDIPILENELLPRLFIIDAELSFHEIGEILNLHKNSFNKAAILGSLYNKRKLIELLPLKADGYLTSDLTENELNNLLIKLMGGSKVFADSLMPEMVEKLSAKAEEDMEERRGAQLTPREREILKLLAAGASNSQIAQKLVISVYTVKNHVHNILEKLGIENRTQLAAYALTRGLVGERAI